VPYKLIPNSLLKRSRPLSFQFGNLLVLPIEPGLLLLHQRVQV
jgi:hypothetical protein